MRKSTETINFCNSIFNNIFQFYRFIIFRQIFRQSLRKISYSSKKKSKFYEKLETSCKVRS